jgi:hypothetical protein
MGSRDGRQSNGSRCDASYGRAGGSSRHWGDGSLDLTIADLGDGADARLGNGGDDGSEEGE